MMDWHEYGDEAAGSLIAVGAMLHGWGMPLEQAIKGLRMAYEIAETKQDGSDWLAKHPSERKGCI